ncbi:metal ABC transporter ATP-binding protein [Corynebacterium sp.]|uniref:metal ABC transporter ATP-binding protein n=1 Tax=Corynebacterium sp. TaxID=1720 RepID=UPI0026DD25AB|nr:metal ABC transporter ATP-binding protein [Corynebacterium sp.]MDO5076908.1 metal ABC transporter ATP-binding protein [Corynebacterium sp.]
MTLAFHNAGIQPLWSGLDFRVESGEFLTVLGPNGVGKSTLLAAILGTRKLTAGSITATDRIGYIPQQRMFPSGLPLRARDLVSLSLAHGMLRSRSPKRREVDELLARVGASHLADRRAGSLSGGQQQLVRQAQALAGDPELLLCDEPLLSLDLNMEKRTVELLKHSGATVVFVTHSINPVMRATDRVLYLAPHGHTVGTVSEVMRGEVLSELYGTKVDVVRVDDRMVVI